MVKWTQNLVSMLRQKRAATQGEQQNQVIKASQSSTKFNRKTRFKQLKWNSAKPRKRQNAAKLSSEKS